MPESFYFLRLWRLSQMLNIAPPFKLPNFFPPSLIWGTSRSPGTGTIFLCLKNSSSCAFNRSHSSINHCPFSPRNIFSDAVKTGLGVNATQNEQASCLSAKVFKQFYPTVSSDWACTIQNLDKCSVYTPTPNTSVGSHNAPKWSILGVFGGRNAKSGYFYWWQGH